MLAAEFRGVDDAPKVEEDRQEATQLGHVLASRHSLLVFAAIVLAATLLPVLSNPLAVIIDRTPWDYSIPLGIVTAGTVLGCVVQAGTLLLVKSRPGIAAVISVVAYVGVVAALGVPNWVAAMPFAVAVAMFFAAAQSRLSKSLWLLLVVMLIAEGGLLMWSLSTGASRGVVWAFVLHSVFTFGAPVAGATALGAWWARRSERVRAAEEAAAASARQLEERVQHARSAERGRIARELHDVAGQHLAGMLSLADAAVDIELSDVRQAAELISDIRSEGKFASAGLYAALRDLDAVDHSSDERTPDVHTLPELMDFWTKRGMRLAYRVQGDVAGLPAAVSTTAYRAVQEALTNSAKHAPGATNAVDVVITSGALRATVVNGPTTRGRGSVRSDLGLGWGLDGIRDKLSLLNGKLTASATPEGGWLVTLAIPLVESNFERVAR